MLQKLFNRNEDLWEPSAAVRRAIRNFNISDAPRYFEGYYGSRLAPLLARRFNVPVRQVSVGYGIEFFLRAIFDSCVPGRDTVLTNAPHYGFYTVYAKVRGVRLVEFDLADRGYRFAFDLAGCLRALQKTRPKVLLITSPNNPTGNSISPRELGKILRTIPKATLVVLDEAYWGFDPVYNEKAWLALLKRHGNLVMLRGFSKRYGLAGLRIGYALWGSRAKALARYDDLYLGGSRLLEEVAIAALKSEPYYRKQANQLVAQRRAFIKEVNRLLHFRAYESDANFVLVKVERSAKRALERGLAKLSVAVSKFVSPDFMRVSLGSEKDIKPFLSALRSAEKAVS